MMPNGVSPYISSSPVCCILQWRMLVAHSSDAGCIVLHSPLSCSICVCDCWHNTIYHHGEGSFRRKAPETECDGYEQRVRSAACFAGELFFFGYNVKRAPHVTYKVANSAGQVQSSVPITIPHGIMMHDFAITQDYAIFLDCPMVFRPEVSLPVLGFSFNIMLFSVYTPASSCTLVYVQFSRVSAKRQSFA